MLGRYTDALGRAREVLARSGVAGSVLVLDRDAATLGDRRLLAHLAADEPAGNAALVCRRYLEQPPTARRCRPVRGEDFERAPFGEQRTPQPPVAETPPDRLGRTYRIELLQSGMSIPELRWCRYPGARCDGEPQPVSVREVIARLESYEPARALTLSAVSAHGRRREASTAVLRAELRRVQESPIVLNRRLREVVLRTIEREAISMSELAIRCGRVKRDRAGNESGETSWLARRLGILPEGGKDEPTPWIHSDVLALIARRGLGIAPREVELA